ncbi:MAG: hypothetical protein HY541_01470 [Deltaproteobacteria bacterium]|nr:hypothetical protein [Deltaproteobacteria bacterium]
MPQTAGSSNPQSSHGNHRLPLWLKILWLAAVAGIVAYIIRNLSQPPFSIP